MESSIVDAMGRPQRMNEGAKPDRFRETRGMVKNELSTGAEGIPTTP